MSLTILKARVIRVGRSIGLTLPIEEAKRWNIEIGDKLDIDVRYIDRVERETYQENIKRRAR